MDYRNNLAKGDRVMHAPSRRVGEVAMQPRETSRNVSVKWQGNTGPQYVDVMELRLIVNGQPEDVAPVDGTPPEGKAELPKASPLGKEDSTAAPLHALKHQRASVAAEMTLLNARYKSLQDDLTKLDRAIAVLVQPVRAS